MDMKGIYGKVEVNTIKYAIRTSFNGSKVNFDNPNQLIIPKLKFGLEQDIEDTIAVYFRSILLINNTLLKEFA